VKNICVFCGAQTGARASFGQAATDLGATMARRGLRLVYGGGRVGLMGIIAQATLDAGGEVIGVIPEFLAGRELLHPDLTETIIVGDLFARKQAMIDRSDAYIAMPGGIGTFDELFEVVAWRQLRRISNPIGILDIDRYFGPMLTMLEHAVRESFLYAEELERLIVANRPATLLDELAANEVGR
jgi:uncharacterized protein (TIGR00730 family)